MRPAERIATGCAALILAATQFGQATSAQGPGRDWQSLTPEQSKIVFVAPGLEDQRVRYMRSATGGHGSKIEVAIWTGPAAHHPKAAVSFIELSPGRHFRAKRDPKRFIERVSAF